MLIFDFDGVLLDSREEAIVTAFNAAMGTMHTSQDKLPVEYLTIARKYRYLVQQAGDFLPYAKWCYENCSLQPVPEITTQQFNAIVTKEQSSIKERTARFFKARRQFVEIDPKSWTSLHKTFEPLWGYLCGIPPQQILILTYKNYQAVLDISRHFGLAIEKENVYSGDGGRTKLENLSQIASRFPLESFKFIDDSIKNLAELKKHSPVPVQLMLASWGYIGKDDTEHAAKEGFEVVTQEDVIRKLKEMS